MIRQWLTLFLVLSATFVSAQSNWLDSTRAIWTDSSRDIDERTIALTRVFFMDSLLTEHEAVLQALHSTVADTSTATYNRMLGFAYYAKGTKAYWSDRYDPALRSMEQALVQFTRVHDRHNMARCSSTIGQVNMLRGDLGRAIVQLQSAVSGLRASGDTVYLADALLSIAYILQLQGNWAMALQRCEEVLSVIPERNFDMRFEVYCRQGAIEVDAHDAQAALTFIRKAQALIDHSGVVDRRGDVAATTGEALLLNGDCAAALTLLQHCLKLNSPHSDRTGMVAYLLSRIARAHLCAHHYALARRSAEQGLAIAEDRAQGKEIIDNLQCLAAAYEGEGDLRKALAYSKRFHALNDSLTNARSTSAVTGALLSADFKHQQFADSVATAQQRERDRLVADQQVEKERTRRNVFLFSGLGLLVFGVVVYRQRHRIQKALHRSDELLLNILPEEVANELKANGHAVAKHFDSATILFTDFKGFTEASEKMAPQDLVEELNTCFETFDHIITARGIEKIKTIGDAYMCVGGLPDPKTSTPADVVHAALEMQAFIIARKKERDAQGLPAFEMRVGIHTGPVVAGIVGVKKFQYDIWGDTVNTASRMESSGEVGQVNISEATYELVKDEAGLTFTPRGKVQAKGKGELEMYFVHRVA